MPTPTSERKAKARSNHPGLKEIQLQHPSQKDKPNLKVTPAQKKTLINQPTININI